MASVAHCLYCFEALAAHLERRKALSLDETQASWSRYAKALEADDGKAAKQMPALRRLLNGSSAGSSSSSSSESPSPSPLPSSSSSTSTSSISLAASTPETSTSSLPGTAGSLITDPSAEFPLFVTWNTLSSRHGRSLRGCIGTFEDLALDEGLASYAVTSAVHDSRFDPVGVDELPDLEVAVTLLTDFEDCRDSMDWVVGVHGLRIGFSVRGRRYGATYLPDVAAEQGWTKEETLVSLMRKAGWTGGRDKWRDVELKVVRYQGKKEHLEYKEYKAWADWRAKQ